MPSLDCVDTISSPDLAFGPSLLSRRKAVQHSEEPHLRPAAKPPSAANPFVLIKNRCHSRAKCAAEADSHIARRQPALRRIRGEDIVAFAVIGVLSVGLWLTYLAAILLGLRLYREILHTNGCLSQR